MSGLVDVLYQSPEGQERSLPSGKDEKSILKLNIKKVNG